LPGFSQGKSSCCSLRRSLPKEEIPEKLSSDKENAASGMEIAQNTRHPPVDGLHSIDFPADKTPLFLLTQEMKGVKTNSFFDSF
jgi:hypothetical protein